MPSALRMGYRRSEGHRCRAGEEADAEAEDPGGGDPEHPVVQWVPGQAAPRPPAVAHGRGEEGRGGGLMGKLEEGGGGCRAEARREEEERGNPGGGCETRKRVS